VVRVEVGKQVRRAPVGRVNSGQDRETMVERLMIRHGDIL